MSPLSPTPPPPLRIGTRSSDLARRQSEYVRDALVRAGHAAELVFMTSKGDQAVDVPFRALEGMGFFSAEIQEALLRGDVDLAVHSLKDLPTQNPPGLVIAANPPREDTRDVLLVHPAAWVDAPPPGGASSARGDEAAVPLPLAPGARVGTSSERRAALLRGLAPDVEIQALRGNVPTRIEKVRRGECDATFLAAAGLRRLGLDPANIDGVRTRILDDIAFPPAPGQGAIAIEVHESNTRARDAAAALNDPDTMLRVTTERALLALLGGGCSLPLGCLAMLEHAPGAGPVSGLRSLRLVAALARDGVIRRAEARGSDPHALAREVMNQLGGPVR